VTPDRISFGNTIKKERDIAAAYAKGVRMFAFDSGAELEKIARVAPGSKVYCRVLMECEGAEWPLSRKFGCEPEMAADLLVRARDLGLDAYGVSFHVGSQQTDLTQFDKALTRTVALFREVASRGIELRMVNMGGGFPSRYRTDVPSIAAYGEAIRNALTSRFGDDQPDVIVEPGRGIVGDAGVIQAEVVLVSQKGGGDQRRWVYLDVGKFHGLAETMDEAIKYRLTTPHDGGETSPVVLAGPTCDSADILYEKADYRLPAALKSGDKVCILATGAYTTTYSAVAFNGFPPLASVCI
jgi:ornithine decarboxylase